MDSSSIPRWTTRCTAARCSIETGGTRRADTIKTHHNRVPIIQEMLAAGRVVEPLADLWDRLLTTAGHIYRDVPHINRCLWWTGPRLPARVVPLAATITRDRLELLRETDACVMDALRRYGIYDRVWQCPTVLVPAEVDGCGREIVIVRPIRSERGMTATPAQLPDALVASRARRGGRSRARHHHQASRHDRVGVAAIPATIAMHMMLFALGLAIASLSAPQEVPSELAALVAKARLSGSVTAWCRAEFRSGHPGAFAVAIATPDRDGRYIALDSNGRVTRLASFAGSADLSCYSRADAEKLDATIRQSETIHGHIAPRWNTTVVCGFTGDTAAACWQYSPADRAFVKVGQWIT